MQVYITLRLSLFNFDCLQKLVHYIQRYFLELSNQDFAPISEVSLVDPDDCQVVLLSDYFDKVYNLILVYKPTI
jgi:hypothetical protein